MEDSTYDLQLKLKIKHIVLIDDDYIRDYEIVQDGDDYFIDYLLSSEKADAKALNEDEVVHLFSVLYKEGIIEGKKLSYRSIIVV